jgi:hypothetical protein
MSGARNAHPKTVPMYRRVKLLMSYFSACTEVGAYPYVVCQE